MDILKINPSIETHFPKYRVERSDFEKIKKNCSEQAFVNISAQIQVIARPKLPALMLVIIKHLS